MSDIIMRTVSSRSGYWGRIAALFFLLLTGPLATYSQALPQLPSGLEQALSKLSSSDLAVRSDGFYALISPYWGDGRAAEGMTGLLRSYPRQADTIKRALIRTLDREAAYRYSMEERGEYLSEMFVNYWADLMLAVGSLRDVRAINGLLAGNDTGGIAVTLLADLCPASIETLTSAIRAPERYFRGETLHWRAGVVGALGECFKRPAAMATNPSAAEKARTVLISALDDADPAVRGAAIGALTTLRKDPLVRARLEVIRQSDHYQVERRPGEGLHFTVREAADHVLSLPADASSFYVVKAPVSRECRVRGMAEAPSGDRLLGPFDSSDIATRSMCHHIDRTRQDPMLCWTVQPRDACN